MRKQILVSDVSGQEIPEGTGSTVTIRPHDNRKSAKELHVTDEESENMGGRTVARRGRKSATASGNGSSGSGRGRARRQQEPAAA